MSNFGPRVIGEAAFADQVARERGGAVFGPRVRDTLAVRPPAVNTATGAVETTEPLPVVEGVTNDGEGAAAPNNTGLSVEEFCRLLDDNHTFLDTLYVQELERPDGPRRECLIKVREVAALITGRPDIITEIDGLLNDTIALPPKVPRVDGAVAFDGKAEGDRLDALDTAALKREAKALDANIDTNQSDDALRVAIFDAKEEAAKVAAEANARTAEENRENRPDDPGNPVVDDTPAEMPPPPPPAGAPENQAEITAAKQRQKDAEIGKLNAMRNDFERLKKELARRKLPPAISKKAAYEAILRQINAS